MVLIMLPRYIDLLPEWEKWGDHLKRSSQRFRAALVRPDPAVTDTFDLLIQIGSIAEAVIKGETDASIIITLPNQSEEFSPEEIGESRCWSGIYWSIFTILLLAILLVTPSL